MARARADSFGCWAAREMSQAARAHQPDGGGHGTGPEQGGQREPPARAAGPAPGCGRRAPPARSAGRPVGPRRPLTVRRLTGSRDTTRSARASRPGRWAAMRTVRPTIRRADGRQHGLLGLPIQVGRRLVEQEQRGVAQEGPGEGHPLTLPGGEPGAAGTEDGVQARRQPGHHVVRARRG